VSRSSTASLCSCSSSNSGVGGHLPKTPPFTRNGQRPAGRGKARQASPRPRQETQEARNRTCPSRTPAALGLCSALSLEAQAAATTAMWSSATRQRRAGPRPDRCRHRAQSVRGRIAVRVDASHRRPAVAVGNDRPARGQLAPERRRRPVGLSAPSTHEQRVAPLDGPGDELDPVQAAVVARSRRIGSSRTRTPAAASDACPASPRRAGPSVNRTTSLLHPDTTSAVRTTSPPLPCGGQPAVTHLPPIAERTVEHRPAPQGLDPRRIR
jgi:hypothetical protein